MNNKKRYTRKNYLKTFIKFDSICGNYSNMFKINRNESKSHRLTKFNKCCELIESSHEVLTEVEFKENKGRADLLAFDKLGNGTIYEVVCSESKESMKKKLNDYPIDFIIVFISAKTGEEINI